MFEDALYTAKAVANSFLRQSIHLGVDDITPMKLQKLIFYAQSWHLKIKNRPLFGEQIERWSFGPVVRDVYFEFKSFGSSLIDEYASDARGFIPLIHQNDGDSLALVNRILEVYGKFSAFELSEMSHDPEGAWAMGELNTAISFEDLKKGKV